MFDGTGDRLGGADPESPVRVDGQRLFPAVLALPLLFSPSRCEANWMSTVSNALPSGALALMRTS